VPSLVFTPEQVPVPGFLFDDPVVRKELSHYYSSVRRADDCVGEVLAALRESGQEDNTFVMFLSDHGMPLPFAKTQLYHHSTRTPLIVKWPGVTRANALDDTHMVSAVDFMPTLLDVIGAKHPEGFDGRSFAAALRGERQPGREFIIKEYNENAGASRDPMRGVQTKRFLYLFNAWSNGERVMATATNGTETCKRMAELARTDKALAARYELYQHRVVEELYDVENDPDCVRNLIADPRRRSELRRLRSELESWMVDTGDHALEAFQKRNDPAVREAYVQAKEKEAEERRKRKNAAKQQGQSKGAKLISWELPKSVTPGKPVTLRIPHKLSAELGKQLVHVTLKAGKDKKRVERKVLEISGEGVLEVSFDIPDPVPGNVVAFAAFVGKDFQRNLQYLTSGLVLAR
jgi:N-sulfoglucosamine sulfohydrolase